MGYGCRIPFAGGTPAVPGLRSVFTGGSAYCGASGVSASAQAPSLVNAGRAIFVPFGMLRITADRQKSESRSNFGCADQGCLGLSSGYRAPLFAGTRRPALCLNLLLDSFVEGEDLHFRIEVFCSKVRGQMNGIQRTQPRFGCEPACQVANIPRHLDEIDFWPKALQFAFESQHLAVAPRTVQADARQGTFTLHADQSRGDRAFRSLRWSLCQASALLGRQDRRRDCHHESCTATY